MTKVAVCTVNWNRKQDTLDLLESLKKLDTKDLSTKIFVVSNQKLPDIDVIYKRQNRGSAGGYNDGAKRALAWGADYVLLLNNDALIKSPNLLKSLIQTANLKPEIGIVSPKMYFAPGFEYKNCKPADRGNILWYAGGDFDWNNVMSSHRGIDEIDSGKYNMIEEIGFTNTTCALVRREVFAKGIFHDEGIFAYFDDNDFQEKIIRTGFKKYYDGKVAIYHKVSQTSGVGSPISDYYISRNRLIFGLRYAPLRTKLALLREALKILVSGRSAQKQGVRDFFLGKVGEKTQSSLVRKD